MSPRLINTNYMPRSWLVFYISHICSCLLSWRLIKGNVTLVGQLTHGERDGASVEHRILCTDKIQSSLSYFSKGLGIMRSMPRNVDFPRM